MTMAARRASYRKEDGSASYSPARTKWRSIVESDGGSRTFEGGDTVRRGVRRRKNTARRRFLPSSRWRRLFGQSVLAGVGFIPGTVATGGCRPFQPMWVRRVVIESLAGGSPASADFLIFKNPRKRFSTREK
jgi:hypothetical protein